MLPSNINVKHLELKYNSPFSHFEHERTKTLLTGHYIMSKILQYPTQISCLISTILASNKELINN